jgi:hypothetical protein
MTSVAADVTPKSLPQLSGRLLRLYRFAWSALAAGALLAACAATLQYAQHPAVVALRLLKSVVLGAVAAMLFCRRQRDPAAGLVALAFLTWAITSSFDFATDFSPAQLLDRCRFLLFALALLLFPDSQWQPGWTRTVAVTSAAVFLIGIGEALHLLRTNLFLPLAIPCVLAGIGSLVTRFHSSTSYTLKQQVKWVALGLIVGVGMILSARLGSATSASRPTVMPVVWEFLFQLGIVVVALGFLVSLLRYRLFDAETVISRSAAYAALTIALVATFGGTEAAIQNLGQEYLGMNIGSISGAMAAAVAAAPLSPLHDRISEWAENRFQPDLALLKREMPEVLARLSVSSSIDRLCTEVLLHIDVAIHSTRSAILFEDRMAASSGVTAREASSWVQSCDVTNLRQCDPRDRLFPCRLRLTTPSISAATWLLLGPRPDGTLPGKEDLDAVRSIFPALGRALTATYTREALDRSLNRRENRLRKEVADLRANVRSLERRLSGRGY